MLNHQSLKKLKRIKVIKKLFLDIHIPSHISKNFKTFTKQTDSNFELSVKELISENQFLINENNSTLLEFYYKKFFYTEDERLEEFRMCFIPWLEHVQGLKGLRILEIGCGEGSSTVALAEQGALVTAIDVNENLLLGAKIKCQLYGLDVRFHLMNATDISTILSNEVFDIIIFMASLEHMTINERIQSMQTTYELLPKGGLWCILDSPNRLHFLDSHTSFLPFFHWLPDEIAVKYSKVSTRNEYRQDLLDIDDEKEKMLQFYRWGRGLSFHEIEIALKPLDELKILSNLASFVRRKNFLYAVASIFTANYKYEKFLSRLYPKINRGFFQPYLNIIVEKE